MRRSRRKAAALVALLVACTSPAVAQQPAAMFGGLLGDAGGDLVTTAATLEIETTAGGQVLRYEGDVETRRGAMTISAAALTVFATGDYAFERIEATGGVEVVEGAQRATADVLMVDMAAQTLTFIGDVIVVQGGSRLSGERLVVNLATGAFRLEADGNGRIETILAPAR